jgi:ATP-binding cassette subfamily B protein
LQDTIDILDRSSKAIPATLITETIKFDHEIALNQISFRYASDRPWILRDVNLTIHKGSRVGFIGKTGTGKSTLIDLIMGLLEPTNGQILVDGCPINSVNYRSWQRHIAHVPQSIYLSDNSIAENIAFGVPLEEIDFQRVRWAAELAQMDRTIIGWDKQYQTIVGERGIQLSGGQRQRIGIARALYKRADVIILDEATSALDVDTEEGVMKAIESLNKNLTIIIIAHRLTTLKDCTKIIELDSKGISWVGGYEDIAKKSIV